MTETTGGSFPGGSYLSGAMPTDEQLSYAIPKEKKGPRDPQLEPHDVFVGMDSQFRPAWSCRTCGEDQGDFATGRDAAESAKQHAGPSGRVAT